MLAEALERRPAAPLTASIEDYKPVLAWVRRAEGHPDGPGYWTRAFRRADTAFLWVFRESVSGPIEDWSVGGVQRPRIPGLRVALTYTPPETDLGVYELRRGGREVAS